MKNFKHIDIKTAKDLIANKHITVVDIRDERSYEQSHIDQAINLSKDNVDDFISSSDKKCPLICYCYHGHSSQTAASFLASQGFEDVYSLDGGYAAWEAENGQ